MPTIAFPRRHLGALQELAASILDKRGDVGNQEVLARELLAGFFEVCQRAGLDGVLVELERALAPLELVDGSALSEEPRLRAELAGKLGTKADFDPRGPRSAKPRQLAECLLAVLSLTLTDSPERTVTLTDQVRGEVTAALASVLDVELAVPRLREVIIATARARCEPPYLAAFDRLAAQLDERGMRMIKQLKLPLEAVQAAQRVLADARTEVLERAARAAIERAQPVLARVSPEAAARLDQPLTHRLTPRDVAVRRASDPRVPRMPEAVAHALLASLTELLELAWGPPELAVRAYAASQTFAVGDLVDHPKFGRGTVRTVAAQRIEVEFADGAHTLVHARA